MIRGVWYIVWSVLRQAHTSATTLTSSVSISKPDKLTLRLRSVFGFRGLSGVEARSLTTLHPNSHRFRLGYRLPCYYRQLLRNVL